MKRVLYVAVLVCLFSIHFIKSDVSGVCAASSEITMAEVEEPQVSIESDSRGIVAIEAGFVNPDDDFSPINRSTGLLVSNSADGVYIVTARSRVTISPEEKELYYKEKKIEDDQNGYHTAIRVYVNGDVQTEPTIVAESKADDFCVLQVSDVLKEKIALHIDDKAQLSLYSPVYSLGFNGIDNDDKWYEDYCIRIESGRVTNAQLNPFIVHSAVVSQECSGGPLINENGYVVGVNNLDLNANEDDEKVFSALPISRVCEILNNYGINYETKSRDDAVRSFFEAYRDAENKSKSEEYSDSSKERVAAEIERIDELTKQKNVTDDTLLSARESIIDAVKALEIKKSSFIIVHIILGGVVALLLITCIVQAVKLAKLKKELMDGNKQVGNQKRVNEPKDPRIWGVSSVDTNASSFQMSDYSDERTIAFSNSMVDGAMLIAEKTGGRIPIIKSPFRIGKSSEKNDYTITGNAAVSRLHAEIIREGNRYLIRDVGSANGTFVNGKRVSGDGIYLQNQDSVVFADEKYVFFQKD